LWRVFSEIGSLELIAWAGFEPLSSWVARITGVSHWHLAVFKFVSGVLLNDPMRIWITLFITSQTRSNTWYNKSPSWAWNNTHNCFVGIKKEFVILY
jgi:hypothetical protein